MKQGYQLYPYALNGAIENTKLINSYSLE